MEISHPDQPRLQRLLDNYFHNLYEELDDPDSDVIASDISIDEAMIITIITQRDEDDNIEERPVMMCTSTRGFVQLGMLETAISEQKRKMNPYLGEDNGDEG